MEAHISNFLRYPEKIKTIAITGASGFIGRALTDLFLSQGYAVLPLSRPAFQLERAGEWRFEEVPDVVIHAAWDSWPRSLASARRINVGGTLALKRLCEEIGVKKFVFISSLAAHEDARSVYGRTKLEAEMVLDPQKDCIVKSGTVIGNGGLIAKVKRLVETMPIIPLFLDGRAALQTVYIDDLCKATLHAVEGEACGVFPIAHERPVSVREVYRELARVLKRHHSYLPFPGSFVLPSSLTERLSNDRIFETRLSSKALFTDPLSFEQSLEKLVA